MFLATRSRWAALAACVLVLGMAVGCGGSGGGPSGDLAVTANETYLGDYIYHVDVYYSGGPLVSATNLSLYDGFTASLGSYAPGPYDIDVFWTDGVVFPRGTDSHLNVAVFDSSTTTITSIEPP